jgi:hypothetical protein
MSTSFLVCFDRFTGKAAFFSFVAPVAEKVRVRELLLFLGKTQALLPSIEGKKTRENVFSFFFASRRSQTENIENIMYRYAPFFISNLLNASDGDESPDENCRRR